MSHRIWTIVAPAAIGSLALGIAAGAWTGRARRAAREGAAEAIAPLAAPAGARAGGAASRRPPPDELVKATETASAAAPSAEPAPAIEPAFEVEGMSAEAWDRLAGLVSSPAADPESRSRLDSLLAELQGKLPTENADGKGEITHPVAVARIVAALLAGKGLAPSPEQWEEIAGALAAYEEAGEEHRRERGDGSLRLERILDEIELKERFLADLSEAFDERQRAAIAAHAPARERWPGHLSPLHMAEVRARPIPRDALELRKLQDLIASDLAGDFAIDAAVAERLVLGFFQEVRPIIEAGGSLSRLDRAIIAGRAHARLFGEVLRSDGVPEPVRERIRDMKEWFVPEIEGE